MKTAARWGSGGRLTLRQEDFRGLRRKGRLAGWVRHASLGFLGLGDMEQYEDCSKD